MFILILLCAPGFPASIECYNTYMSVSTRIAIQKDQFWDSVSTNALSRREKSPGFMRIDG
jgi:hypothetical protein